MKWVTKGINLIKSIGWNVLIPAPIDEMLSKLDPNIEYIVEIKRRVKRRSLNANAYAWVLCDKIARELSKNGYISKNDVYKRQGMQKMPAQLKQKDIQLSALIMVAAFTQ